MGNSVGFESAILAGIEESESSDFKKVLEDRSFRDKCIEDQKVVRMWPEDIHPDPSQPRKEFDILYIQELASSMDDPEIGQEQPIVVYYSEKNQRFEILVGENRWRGKRDYCKNRTIEVVIKEEPSEESKYDRRVQENLQRKSFTVLEMINIVLHYKQQFERNEVSAINSAIAERMKINVSMISLYLKVADAMVAHEDFAAVVKKGIVKNTQTLYDLAKGVLCEATPRRKAPLEDLIYCALNKSLDIGRNDASKARKQAMGEEKVPHSYVSLKQQDLMKEAETGTPSPESGTNPEESIEAEQKEEGQPPAPKAVKPKALKTLAVAVDDESKMIHIRAKTGFMTKGQALTLAAELNALAANLPDEEVDEEDKAE